MVARLLAVHACFAHYGTGDYTGGRVEILDTSFVGDVGSLTGANASEAVGKGKRFATIAAEVYILYGMPSNFKRA